VEGPLPTVTQSPQSDVDLIADVVYRTFSIDQDLHVDPQHREAFLIPQMIVMALGLDESLLDEASEVWDQVFKAALAECARRVRDLRQP
jgi:hypothetical protein